MKQPSSMPPIYFWISPLLFILFIFSTVPPFSNLNLKAISFFNDFSALIFNHSNFLAAVLLAATAVMSSIVFYHSNDAIKFQVQLKFDLFSKQQFTQASFKMESGKFSLWKLQKACQGLFLAAFLIILFSIIGYFVANTQGMFNYWFILPSVFIVYLNFEVYYLKKSFDNSFYIAFGAGSSWNHEFSSKVKNYLEQNKEHSSYCYQWFQQELNEYLDQAHPARAFSKK